MRKITEVKQFLNECNQIEDEASELRNQFLQKQKELESAYHKNYVSVYEKDSGVKISYAHDENLFTIHDNSANFVVLTPVELKFILDEFESATEGFEFIEPASDDELSAEAS